MEPSIEKDSISAHQNYEGKSNYSKKDIVGEERSVFIKNKSKVGRVNENSLSQSRVS